MKVHLVNPSDVSFGTAVITPRWLYVIADATPKSFGDPVLVDETLEQIDPLHIFVSGELKRDLLTKSSIPAKND